MIPATTNFQTYRNATGQQPIVVLSLPGLGLTYSNRAVAGLSATMTTMQLPSGISQQISDLQGSATLGSMVFTVVDLNRQLLPLLATKQWYGAAANVQVGFAGLTYPADYLPYMTGNVLSIVPTADHTGWTITVADKKRTLITQAYTIGDDGISPVGKNNPRTLAGNPLDLVLDLLQNELGIASSDVDTAAIAALRNGRFSATRMLFSLTSSVSAMSFLEQELLQPNGLFHFARYSGAISIADILSPPVPLTLALSLTKGAIIGMPTFRPATIYNCVEFDLDYDGSNYRDTKIFVDDDSVAKFQLQSPLKIQSQGMRTNLQGASRAGITARRIFLRYAGGPANQITLRVGGLYAITAEVGDYIEMSHDQLENLDSGTLGWNNRVGLVLNVQPSWAQATTTLDVLDITNELRAPYVYAPDGTPVWASASSSQKATYMFMANSSEQQSDGTSAAGVF